MPELREKTSHMSGKHIELFLVDGTPGGLTTVEITNWTGHILVSRRSDLHELMHREGAVRTGVYLLLGDNTPTRARCYIGDADVIAERLRSHNQERTSGVASRSSARKTST